MKKLYFAIIFLSFVIFIFSDEYNNANLSRSFEKSFENLIDILFSKEEQSKMVDGKFISRMFAKHNPKHENTHSSIDIPITRWTTKDLSKYEIIIDDKVFFYYDIKNMDEEKKLDFLNYLVSYSKLKDMVFYSKSSKKNEILLKKSCRVDNNNKELEDIKYDKLPPYVKNRSFQKDARLGETYFTCEIYNYGNNFVLVNSSDRPIVKALGIGENYGDYKVIAFYLYDERKGGYYCYFINAFKIDESLVKLGTVTPTIFSYRIRASMVHFLKFFGKDYSNALKMEN